MGEKLGLAEFSSGKFIGEDALYKEFFTISDKHYFPCPSLLSSTDFLQIRNTIAKNVDTMLYRDGTLVKRVYPKKTSDGVVVVHHSALTYLGVKRARNGNTLIPGITIKDDNVLDDHHLILLPKAVECSTGILDFFFRGKMDVTSTFTAPNQITLHVINRSLQPMSGGTFNVYGDDSSGNRSLVQSFNNTTLADNAAVDLTFTRSSSAVKYILVYKGTIGTDAGGQPQDPVDKDIAIAVKTFDPPEQQWTLLNENHSPPDAPSNASASGNAGVIIENHAEWVFAEKIFYEKPMPLYLASSTQWGNV